MLTGVMLAPSGLRSGNVTQRVQAARGTSRCPPPRSSYLLPAQLGRKNCCYFHDIMPGGTEGKEGEEAEIKKLHNEGKIIGSFLFCPMSNKPTTNRSNSAVGFALKKKTSAKDYSLNKNRLLTCCKVNGLRGAFVLQHKIIIGIIITTWSYLARKR